ncbi:hypothetical protein Vretimale_11850 [Volvox reticuliferus]|uniref:Gem-associated protein 2 n=1 Tax=Volvox reticuliferus TaxID=1737510 RepID=A0A8J4CIH7_9CHLO|nr:hypothetical protein Vretifemale_11407 [Volvox reticuliferus]GIM07786.1 hypothetical protein Vretimale_11850 [Volvox reticuliferus]
MSLRSFDEKHDLDIEESPRVEDDEEEDDDGAMVSSDDEEYNLSQFGIAQALPVPDGLPDIDAGPPQTAEEYLRWVRFEASRCPRITRKDIDSAILERQEQRSCQRQQQQTQGCGDVASTTDSRGATTAAGRLRSGNLRRGSSTLTARVPPPITSQCPEWARPSPQWLAIFLQDFYQLRQALGALQRQHAQELASTPLPSLSNTHAWDRLCFEQWQPLEQQPQEQVETSSKECNPEPMFCGERNGEDDGRSQPPPPPPPPASLHAAGGSGLDSEVGSSGLAEQQLSQRHRQQNSQQSFDTRRARGPLESPEAGGSNDGNGEGLASSARQRGETDRLCGPVVRTVLALDQVSVGFLIQRHVGQLNSQSSLSYIRSQWLFALAAVLERPVPPDVAAAMRDLVRRCSAWRADLKHPEDPVLPRLNVLLAVAGGYFGQDELLCAAAVMAGLGDLA